MPRSPRWKQNKADELLHGTRNFGERNGLAVLTEKEVMEIAALLASGAHLQKDIAEAYGVCREAVSCIARGKNWGWLTGLKPKPKKEKASAKTLSSNQ